MNDRGRLHLQRCELFLAQLAENEKTVFDSDNATSDWLRKRLHSNGPRRCEPSRSIASPHSHVALNPAPFPPFPP